MNIIKTEIEHALCGILSGKEERVRSRDEFLSENIFVCQITLNIPGYPKRLTNDEKAVERFRSAFIKQWNSPPLREKNVANAAGVCWLGFFAGGTSAAQKAKRIAVSIEEETPDGRISDIDIIVTGGTISRSDLKLPQRKCLLCGRPAKECARDRNHSYSRLRSEFEKLIKKF